MNERIRELVGRAKFMAEETINKQISKNAELDAFAEKFAELIVQECARAIINDSRLNDVRSASRGCVRTIREHFGVEE